jgi:hypothetical protein
MTACENPLIVINASQGTAGPKGDKGDKGDPGTGGFAASGHYAGNGSVEGDGDGIPIDTGLSSISQVFLTPACSTCPIFPHVSIIQGGVFKVRAFYWTGTTFELPAPSTQVDFYWGVV